jgi:hypothetical protein
VALVYRSGLRSGDSASLHVLEKPAWTVSGVEAGGRANVDFYTTEKNGNTIVLVFMYADMDNNLATVQQILKSFSW